MKESAACELAGAAGSTSATKAITDAGSEEVAALARAAADGDRAALAALYDGYRPLLAGVIGQLRRRLPPGVERMDLQQEAARVFCESVRSYDPSRRVNLTTYLVKSVRWRVANYLRAEARRAGQVPLEAAHLDELAEDVASSPTDTLSPRVSRALSRLSPRQRAVVAGLYWRERTTVELARELGITAPAVTALRRRAERAIREELGEP
jgi:RNA polymerase sigma factor (sigma-70 family)